MMLLETFAAGPFQCNCSVLACAQTKTAVVVDPGGETQRIAEIIAHHGLTLTAIVHTHAHLDHIYATRDVKLAHGGAICLHRGDTFLYDGFAHQAAMFGWAPRPTLPIDRFIEHGDTVVFGSHALEVVHTPGHTPGSVCFALESSERPVLFAGDTLFRRSIGRTDLPGGDPKLIAQSIKTRLYSRNLDTLVITGHGPTTTLGDEAIRNPFVTAA